MSQRIAAIALGCLLAACGGDSTPTAPVVVVPKVVSVTITGATTSEVGVTTPLTAVAKDSAGATMTGVTITWGSSDPGIISVASTGIVTATRIGTATITAGAGTKSASITFTSNLTPYTFVFASGTSSVDQQTIRDGVQYAHAYHQAVFGRQITQASTISTSTTASGCAQGGAAAFTGIKA